jgi:hypothetical protein
MGIMFLHRVEGLYVIKFMRKCKALKSKPVIGMLGHNEWSQ